jgi:hypothetical protein
MGIAIRSLPRLGFLRIAPIFVVCRRGIHAETNEFTGRRASSD